MPFLSKKEKEIIVGSLLGDENMRMMGRNKNPVFCVSHGEREKNYVFWKYKQLQRWVKTSPWREERIYYKDRTRKLISWRFQTLSNSAFSDIYQDFYPRDEKILPKNINAMLHNSPLALAVWIMDDGSRNANALYLSTQSFSLIEQKRLIKTLEKVFGFKATINKHSKSEGKQLYRIRISTESTKELANIVQDFILPEFRYKVPTLSP